MAALLLISTPNHRLTYEDGDVVSLVATESTPGKAVIQNSGGDWSFLYVTDKDVDSEELLNLVKPNTKSSEPSTPEAPTLPGGFMAPSLGGVTPLPNTGNEDPIIPEPEIEEPEFLGKRQYCIALPGDVDTYTTYAAYDEASEDMKMTWSEISPLITDKQG